MNNKLMYYFYIIKVITPKIKKYIKILFVVKIHQYLKEGIMLNKYIDSEREEIIEEESL